MDRSGQRKDELRAVATKIKMRRNWDVSEYLKKHRILQNDMIDENCDEIIQDSKEGRTVQYILQKLRNEPEWEPYCAAGNV